MCGVAFCQAGIGFGGARPSGCPLHNLIPEWNDLMWRGLWREAAERLALTSPLPEFTSRVCPALCEAACNLGCHDEPETIHDNERAISDWEWEHGGPRRFFAVTPDAPRVTVVGSGPARPGGGVGARPPRRARARGGARRPRGGLLMYGIPNMKLEKQVVERRVRLMGGAGRGVFAWGPTRPRSTWRRSFSPRRTPWSWPWGRGSRAGFGGGLRRGARGGRRGLCR